VDAVVDAFNEEAGKHYCRELTGLSRRDRTLALAKLLDSRLGSREKGVKGVAQDRVP
jgi:hypothetical protein